MNYHTVTGTLNFFLQSNLQLEILYSPPSNDFAHLIKQFLKTKKQLLKEAKAMPKYCFIRGGRNCVPGGKHHAHWRESGQNLPTDEAD